MVVAQTAARLAQVAHVAGMEEEMQAVQIVVGSLGKGGVMTRGTERKGQLATGKAM